MMKSNANKSSYSTLICIVVILVMSCGLRLGGIGFAIASENEPPVMTENEKSATEPSPDIDALLKVIQERTAELDKKEMELAERSYSLNAAETLIQQNLERLAEAEKRLQATITKVDGAAEGDLDRLTAVYESMKPKVAAGLFEQMNPEFAAGFLGRMAPQAAADIMSGLSSESGYAISVVLAGRNATAPTQ